MATIYSVNRGINKSIEFKGLKAQYIWWLGGGIIVLLILFAILYIAGLNTFLCLGIIALAGTAWFVYVYRLSRQYGEYGMMKKIAARQIPGRIKASSRKIFMQWKNN